MSNLIDRYANKNPIQGNWLIYSFHANYHIVHYCSNVELPFHDLLRESPKKHNWNPSVSLIDNRFIDFCWRHLTGSRMRCTRMSHILFNLFHSYSPSNSSSISLSTCEWCATLSVQRAKRRRVYGQFEVLTLTAVRRGIANNVVSTSKLRSAIDHQHTINLANYIPLTRYCYNYSVLAKLYLKRCDEGRRSYFTTADQKQQWISIEWQNCGERSFKSSFRGKEKRMKRTRRKGRYFHHVCRYKYLSDDNMSIDDTR